tara:strand:- start:2450 stop:3031 length:582 start_codon:yes stop_codon:yes gene_type:complete
MSSTTLNQDEINEGIIEIFNECLLEKFIDEIDDMFWFSNHLELREWIDDVPIQEIFNSGYDNILEEHNKSYTLDFKTSINLLKYIKEELVNNYGSEDVFCNMFDEDENSETKIINMYAYFYIKEEWTFNNPWDYLLVDKMRNIAKYNFHKKKYNKLINLYEKLDKKTKQKKTIIKILNEKFNTDILQNIICAY